ncbi:6966_t:CDS:2, partial [Gigaspora rosea]
QKVCQLKTVLFAKVLPNNMHRLEVFSNDFCNGLIGKVFVESFQLFLNTNHRDPFFFLNTSDFRWSLFLSTFQ